MSALEYSSTDEDKYRCHFKIGKCYLQSLQYKKSVDYYKSALEYSITNNDKLECYFGIGESYFNLV